MALIFVAKVASGRTKMHHMTAFVVAISTFLIITCCEACTTYAVGLKATADGSVMSVHTSDGSGTTDPRLVKIPAQDWPPNSKRPIWESPEKYPRFVGVERGAPVYYKENCLAGINACKDFVPMGYIDQVNHTFSYFEETYGAMNEKQVMIAESTCSGVFVSTSIARGGKALFSVDQLSQVAMERASTAREAVLLMGSLSEQYGFYGESTSFEGGSESLIVSDPREAWVFHVLADDTGASAIWVAARVPDDSVAVVANMFSVRVVDLEDDRNFLGRTDMWELASRKGLWSPEKPKDFTATFSDGEYAHKYYSGRRMWGVYRLLSPDTPLPAEYENLKTDAPYPFAVKVSDPSTVTPQTLMAVNRDFYNGTQYSTGDGNLAGGFGGTPDRVGGQESGTSPTVSGNWERTVALYRTSCSYVLQGRSFLPDSLGGVLWFGSHSATATVYVPLVAAMPKSPDSIQYGWQGSYNLSSLFWANRNVANLIQKSFSKMVRDVRAAQHEIEALGESLVSFDSYRLDRSDAVVVDAAVERQVSDTLNAHVDFVLKSTTELLHVLQFKYADGFENTWTADGHFQSATIGYPGWWLSAVGYQNGPPPP